MMKEKFADKWEEYIDFPESEINTMMVYAGLHGEKVKVIDTEDDAYEGTATAYSRADDEEDRDPKIFIKNDNGGWFLGLSEIKSIEEMD